MSSRDISITLAICAVLLSLGSCRERNEEPGMFTRVSGFVINEKGMKLLATDAGLFNLNTRLGNYIKVSSPVALPGSLNHASYFKQSSHWELWLTSDAGAFNLYTKESFTKSNGGLHSNLIKYVAADTSGRICFACPDGLSVLNDSVWIKYQGFDNLYSFHEISGIGAGEDGFFYVTTRGGGVECFSLDADGISGATLYEKDWSKLGTNNVFTIFMAGNTQVYGTDKGIAMHFSRYTKWDWEAYNKEDGLVCDTVYAITKDRTGAWWFGTHKGISRYDGGEWQSFTPGSAGIPEGEFLFSDADTDSSVWFVYKEGLLRHKNGIWDTFPFLSANN